MKLRNGKRSLREAQEIYEKHEAAQALTKKNSKSDIKTSVKGSRKSPRKRKAKSTHNSKNNKKSKKSNTPTPRRSSGTIDTLIQESKLSVSAFLESMPGPSGSNDQDTIRQMEILEFSKKLSEKVQKTEKKGRKLLNKSDILTFKLYEMNRKINIQMLEILEYKNQKIKNICVKTLENKESELKLMRDEHKEILHESKVLLLEAKRIFSLAKRLETGKIKTEKASNTTRHAKNSKIFML